MASCLVPYFEPGSTISRGTDHLLTADLNGDGKPDIAGNTASEIFVILNDGSGQFTAATTVYTGTIAGAIITGDFDGDTKADIAFASGSSIIVLPGTGAGTFGSPIASNVTIAPAALTAAKLDAGNSIDLVAYDSAANVMVAFSNDGTARFAEVSRSTIGANSLSIAAADLDADGSTDVVVGHATGSSESFYGRGDGTFEAARSIATGSSQFLRIENLDAGGLPDLITASEYSMSTLRNLGGRTFGDPRYYSYNNGIFQDMTTADFTGDGLPDVVTLTSCDFLTWRSTGLATLDSPWQHIAYCLSITPPNKAISAADFDGDGRIDTVLTLDATTNHPSINIYRNRCGDSLFSMTVVTSMVTIGEAAALNVRVRPPVPSYEFSGWFAPTGQISIKEAGQTLGSLTASAYPPVFLLYGLSLGDHTLVASFEGDAEYSARDSEPVTVQVTNDSTTTSISVSPVNGEYGLGSTVSVDVVSSTGDTPTGPIRFLVDGLETIGSPASAPHHAFQGPFFAGSHTLVATFEGDATHPRSTATRTYVIAKQIPRVVLTPASAVEGAGFSAFVHVSDKYLPYSPSGSVSATLETTSLGTSTLSGGYAAFTFPALAAGRYQLHVSYSGDQNYQATERIIPIVIFSTGQASIDARGTTDGINVTWYSPNLTFLRRALPSQWSTSIRLCCLSAPSMDTSALPETPYLYRMESSDGSTASNVDLGMRISFTDDPVVAGVTIKAVHLQEIIRGLNILLTAANLSATSVNIAPGSVVTAAQINGLHTAINEARAALGANLFSFTRDVSPGTTIRALDVQELREAIR
ncbi:MAG: FG-GAP-like repeat-containing protein [Acidobacteriota bacterium]